MKLTDAEIIEGGKKVRFVFYSEDRVDFRSLIKDLANALRLRIEMKQIGARDEAKYKGCLGACGQVTTCCSTFLRQFRPISVGMAKTQGLSPNPTKLAGLCGKLKCCLAYENELYAEFRKGLLKSGAIVKTAKGIGEIQSIDILNRHYSVRLDEGGMARLPADACSVLEAADKAAREKALTDKLAQDRRREEEFRSRREKRDKAVQNARARKPAPSTTTTADTPAASPETPKKPDAPRERDRNRDRRHRRNRHHEKK